MSRKIKLYLDTSVVSHLCQEDAPEKMKDTLKLWDAIKIGAYDVYLSQTTIDEIAECKQPKLNIMLGFLAEINYHKIDESSDILMLANKIIDTGILKKKNIDDCMHIASATVAECDIIASWNFKHLVNVKTINGVRGINILNGYKSIDIYSPSMLIEMED